MENQPAHSENAWQNFAEIFMPLLRSALLGDLTANILHDINNPLTAILNYARLLQMGQFSPEEKDGFLKGLVAEGERIFALSNLMSRMLPPQESAEVGANLPELLDLALHLLRTRFRQDGIVVEYQPHHILTKTPTRFTGGAQILLLVFEKIRRELNAPHLAPTSIKTIRCEWHTTAHHQSLQFIYNLVLPQPQASINLFDHWLAGLPEKESTQFGLEMTQAVLRQADCKIAVRPQAEGWTAIQLDFPR